MSETSPAASRMTIDGNVRRIRLLPAMVMMVICWMLVRAGSAEKKMSNALKPAYRISCRSDQPGIKTATCGTMNRSWPVNQMLMRVCEEKIIFPQEDLNNSFVLMSLSKDLNMEVIILRCPCYDPQASTPCPDTDFSRQNFTCMYQYTDEKHRSTSGIYLANISEVNVTAPTCCRSGCEEEEEEGGRKSDSNNKENRQALDMKPADSADGGPLVAVIVVLSIAVVALALLCLYLWRSRQHQRQNNDMGGPDRGEMDILRDIATE